MPDPFESLPLLVPDEPVEPRPAFAATLRRRLADALASRGAIVTATLTPYLCAHDAEAALRFYAEAFGAVETMRVPYEGKIGHAELEIGGARFMLSDEFPDHMAVSPRELGGSPVMLHLDVDDVDAVVAQAAAAGATVVRPVADQAHGNRNGVVVDPFGHRWMISTPLRA